MWEFIITLLIGILIGAMIGVIITTMVVDEGQDIDEDDLFKG